MDDHTWTMLASVMTLLTASRLSHTSTVPLAEQLLYLAHGELALLSEMMDTPPPEGVQIPPEVWDALQRAPLSLEYYDMVVQSLQTHPQFWEGALDCCGKKEEGELEGDEGDKEAGDEGDKEAPGGESSAPVVVVRDLSDFPWTSQGQGSIQDYSPLSWVGEMGGVVHPYRMYNIHVMSLS